jgi:hypothetical protein
MLKMNVEKINELQFLHKVKLTNTATSIIEICDKNEVLESDIFTISSFLYYLSQRTPSEKIAIVSDFSYMSRSQQKSLLAETDLDGKLFKMLADVFYKKINGKKLLMSLQVPYNEANRLAKENYCSFMQFYVNDFYKDFDDERFIRKFVNLVENADYSNAVRLYFLAICLGRNSLIDKYSRIQRDKCRSNFIYALNREIIMLGTLLVKYGRGKEVELLAEQTIELSDNAVDEANKHIIDLQLRTNDERLKYEERIRCLEAELSEAHHTISELRLEVSEFNNQLILENQKVLVVGDEGHIEGYREVIEKYGGNFDFVSGFSKGATARRKAIGADIVFFVTAWAHHEVTESIKEFSNLVWVNSAGIDSLEREVLKLRKKEVK